MKRILALALTFAVILVGSPVSAGAPPAVGKAIQQGGSIGGTASSQTGDVLPNVTVQLRDLATGQVVSTQTTNEGGAYLFNNLAAGNYAVEAVNAAGQVIGTSASISLTAGQAITGIVLQANAGLLGAGGAAAAGGAGGIGPGLSAAIMIAVAAGTAFIGARTVTSNTSSPSR